MFVWEESPHVKIGSILNGIYDRPESLSDLMPLAVFTGSLLGFGRDTKQTVDFPVGYIFVRFA
jgi:hypothetical protein